MYPSRIKLKFLVVICAALVSTDARAGGLFDWIAGYFQGEDEQQAPRQIEPPKMPEGFYATPPVEKPAPLAPGYISTPPNIDFGSINFEERTSLKRSVPLTNTGETEITGIEYGLSGDGVFNHRDDCKTLAPNSTCQLVVEFAPGDVGDFNAQLIIASSIGIHQLGLSGNAYVPPAPVPLPSLEDNKLSAMEAWRQRRLSERNMQGPSSKGTDASTRRVPPPRYEMTDTDYSREKTPGIVSSYPVNRRFILTMDRWISVTVKHEVNSQLPGIIHFEIDQNVLGTDGYTKLLEKGDTFLGRYEPLEKVGDTRLNVCIFRLVRLADGAHLFDSEDECFAYATDRMMRVGLVGHIDNRFWETYGSAFVTASVGAASTYGTSQLSTSEEINQAGETLKDQFAEITVKMLERNVDLAPIITVAGGEIAGIQLLKDIYIRRPDVKE